MLADLGNVRSSLRKSQVRVNRLDGRCHLEDSKGEALEEVVRPIVAAAIRASVDEPVPVAVAVNVHTAQRLAAPYTQAHGSRAEPNWAMPRLTKLCEANARPGYLTAKAHEYLDEDKVLNAKVRMLASMLQEAKKTVAYTGAGISVTAGIPDWATKHGNGSSKKLTEEELAVVAAAARPTIAHRVLVAAHGAGLLQKWIQQNHDGLPQKAGFPQEDMNEIHGAIFDPSNPLVPMDGKVREDLHSDLLQWERNADLVLALGSSLCGMAADSLVRVVADRERRRKALGAVIITVQKTVCDEDAALRIFAPLDRVAELLAQELKLHIPDEDHWYVPAVPAEYRARDDLFSVPYGSDGRLKLVDEDREMLDLSLGAKVTITAGPNLGAVATSEGQNDEGHYRLRLGSSGSTRVALLGSWWVEAAVLGRVPSIPVVTLHREGNTSRIH